MGLEPWAANWRERISLIPRYRHSPTKNTSLLSVVIVLRRIFFVFFSSALILCEKEEQEAKEEEEVAIDDRGRHV